MEIKEVQPTGNKSYLSRHSHLADSQRPAEWGRLTVKKRKGLPVCPSWRLVAPEVTSWLGVYMWLFLDDAKLEAGTNRRKPVINEGH